VFVNIVSALEGEKGKVARAVIATYRSVFPETHVFLVRDSSDGQELQNIIMVALKRQGALVLESDDPELQEYLSHRWDKEVPQDIPVLTDDHAPADFYAMQAVW